MPDWTGQLRSRLAGLRLSPARETEIIEELAQHLDQRYEELRSGDASDADARRLVIAELLEPDALADHMRSLRQANVAPPITPGAPDRFLLGDLTQDLRYGLRTLRRAPGFAVASTLTLALGIGATSVMFSWVTTILTAAAPVAQMNRLAFVWSHNRSQGETKTPVSLEDFVEWRRRQRSFDRFSAQRRGAVNLSGADQPVRATANFVTADFVDVFSQQPTLGRAFRPEEEQSGSPRVAILSDRFWRERFGGRIDVLGRELLLDGRPATIVGVLPKSDFTLDLMLPLVIDPAARDYAEHSVFVVARLRDGVPLEQARTDMEGIGEQLERELPDTHRGWGVNTRPAQEEFIGPQARLVLGLLAAAAGAVLLIGCANIASLLLVRGVARARELAVRTAIGAGRMRLLRQLLAENLLLAVAGTAAGLLVAQWGLGLLRATIGGDPATRSIMERAVIDRRVLAFAAAACLLSTLLFGLLPALHTARLEVAQTLRAGSRPTGGLRARRLRDVLVAAEVAMAVLFLVVAMLFMRTVTALQRIEPGFDATNVLTLRVSLPEARYAADAAVADFYDRVVERLRASQDVIAAGGGLRVPAAGSRYNPNRSVVIQGRTATPGETQFAADLTVTPGYLETLRIPLRRGRALTPADGAGAPLAVMVSEMMVRRYWNGLPDASLGARIRLGDEPSPDVWRTVVGIVGDVRNDDIESPPLPMVYVPLAQRPAREMTIAVRTAGDPLAHVAAAREAVAAVDPEQPIYDVKTMAQILDEDLRQSVVLIAILGLFAGVALALAAVGIYVVVAHAVAQRTHEIGVRMALGATIGDVLPLVMRQGFAPVGAGLTVGIGAAIGASQLLREILYGVTPTDAVTYGSVMAILAAVALVACLAPARRAAKIDPLLALRSE
jgi:putative ABC transport system permease protein